MDSPKKLNKGELRNLFERARFYPVDIKQKFWELGHHIKALEAEIKALQDEKEALKQTNLKLESHVVSEPMAAAKEPIKSEAEGPKSGEHFAGMFNPSGVTREQIAFTLCRRRFASAKDEQAYNGFKNLHRLSDGSMQELAEKWERQKLGSNAMV
jgi:hypothetical protein